MSTTNDGSESVDQFLARIASLKGGRDEAEEEKSRRMEEEFIKNRKERQARRLERARSLSPSKTGPARTNPLSLDPPASAEKVINPPVDFSPRPQGGLSRSNAVRTSPTLEPSVPRTSPKPNPGQENQLATSTLARSGTLSWQQRPRNGDSNRTRPLSVFATVRSHSKPTSEEQDAKEPSREEIAASLGLKDPSWFRQTQDRGLSSAAYRKNQVEDTPQETVTAKGMRLPGLSRETSPLLPDPFAGGQQNEATVFQLLDSSDKDRFKRGNTPDIAALRMSMASPPVLNPEKQEYGVARPDSREIEGKQDSSSERQSPGTNFQANRSVSPTKGLGGFVESAMMRRSDSVSKRWNVPASTGLKRGDSVAGMRPPTGVGSMHNRGPSRDNQFTKEPSPSSPLSTSRPGSSRGIKSSVSPPRREMLSVNDKMDGTPNTEIPVSAEKATSTRVANSDKSAPLSSGDDDLPRSPSKTMDPRRWSPTKSSWLESALNAKPEPSKMQPLKDDQPAWMVELQRSKSRATRDPSPSKVAKVDISNTPSTPDFSRPISGIATTRPRSIHGSSKSFSSPSKDSPAVPTSPVKQSQLPTTDSRKELTEVAKGEENRKLQDDPKTSKDVFDEEKPATELSSLVNDPGSQTKRPPALKPKPQTSPKTDFRSGLKPRTPATDSKTSSEPEFRSVFGKLKPATTQNYVAPDELKNNILRGKAGLSVTDGPQKSKRVDEFKESILAKKEAMKTGSATVHKRAESHEKPEAPVPEALARRKTLTKANAPNLTQNDMSQNEDLAERSAKPQIMPKPKNVIADSRKTNVVKDDGLPSRAAPADKPTQPARSSSFVSSERTQPIAGLTTEKSTSKTLQTDKEVSSALNPGGLPGVQTGKQAQIDTTKISVSSVQTLQTMTTSPTRTSTTKDILSGLPAGSKLASRLNPNLASMIARGTSPRPPMSESNSSEQVAVVSTGSINASKAQDEGASANLTHMTKSRAKGPKRRAPKAENAEQSNPPKPVTSPKPHGRQSDQPGTGSPLPTEKASLSPPLVLPDSTATPNGSKKIPKILDGTDRLPDQLPSMEKVKSKPVVSVKSPQLRQVSNSGQGATAESPKPSPKPKNFKIASDNVSPPLTNRPLLSNKSPPPIASERSMPLSPSTSKINSPKLPQHSEASGTKSSTKPANGLGVQLKPAPSVSAKKPDFVKSSPQTSSGSKQPAITSDDGVKSSLDKHFSSMPERESRGDFDTQAFLNKIKVEQERTRTIQNIIMEITGDGKKSAMPPQQEHILFEESMYLVIHTFERSSGNKTAEAFLWCGDEVSDAAVEDAQLFCKKDAREHNTKLELIRQGKEPPQFFQALGGIVIIRRSKSSAFYMLCGRRYFGHVAFDEVDTVRTNLCSGFAYLISAQFGKLYLWKGKGAGADEVGCARLIGMDLGLTGEIEEVDEGKEPKSFWDVFPSKESANFSDDWAKRSELQGLPSALYRVEHEQPKASGGFWGLRPASPTKTTPKVNLDAISPFDQRDVQAPHIHILDTYRSVFILVNDKVSTKSAEFVSATYVAQEIAMLAPAMQDRPILPVCYVCFGEPPGDVRITFRKWHVRQAPKAPICVPLEDVMEFLKL